MELGDQTRMGRRQQEKKKQSQVRTNSRFTHTKEEYIEFILRRKGKLFLINTINCSPEYTRAQSIAYNSSKINKTVSCVLQALSYKYTEKKDMQYVLLLTPYVLDNEERSW